MGSFLEILNFKSDHSDSVFQGDCKKDIKIKRIDNRSQLEERRKSQRVTCGFVVFTGHRCPHSFTECITTISRDEVILSPSDT